MAADAVTVPGFPNVAAPGFAWPAVRAVQSTPRATRGVATIRAMDGRNRAQERTEEERLQARASEAQLIREAQAGSRAAFDALVKQYEQQVLRLALHLTGSEHD